MSRKNILIVDDEACFTRMVKLNLECNGGYSVTEVNHASDAIPVARRTKPDLILLDVIMPGMDGGELASRLRNDPGLSQIPMLFLTATISPTEAGRKGFCSGGFVFLAKPVALDDLLACIELRLAGADLFRTPAVLDRESTSRVAA